RVTHVRRRVEATMRRAAESHDFVRAANLRDVLTGMHSIEQRQRAMNVRGGDVDVIGTARDGDPACAVQLRIRDGKLLGRELDFFDNVGGDGFEELLSAGVSRFYFG